jgi:hypothetical protein
MLDWMKRRVAGGASLSVVARVTRGGPGRYGRLHDYLQDRHADRVVLTFKEIEDLLGFTLPEDACSQAAWWGNAESDSAQSDAWTFAGRTASVNLIARSAVFDRDAALDFSPGS